jgi:hypothetical protein
MQEMTDDTEIFACLEKAGQASFDPLKELVLDFVFDADFYLLLFCPSGTFKGCRMFIVPLHRLAEEAGQLLLPSLLHLPDDPSFANLKNRALAITEEIIADRDPSRLFFDAH